MKRKVKFDLFPKKVKGVLVDCRPIRMRISYGGNRVDIRVGFSIEPEKWKAEEGRVISGAKNKYKQSASEINKAILKSEEIVEEVFTRYEHLEKRVPTTIELKHEFDKITGRENQVKKEEEKKKQEIKINVFNIYDKFIAEESLLNSWSPSHKNRHITVKNHLAAYKSTLNFDKINKDTLKGFLNHLLNKDLHNTTISKLIAYLRNFLRWAKDNGFYEGDQHEKFKPKLKGADGSCKEVIYLTWEELTTLYNLDIPEEKKYLGRIRDVFCFCCFTGLRYSDAFNLSKSDIQNERISVITQKTIDPLYIELNDYSTALLNKYKGLPQGKALPVISNQKMNDYLKELGRLAKFTTPTKKIYFKNNVRYEEIHPKCELLSTHCGRRTFIVLAITLGIPIPVIMKWTGHKSYAAMKPYIKIVDSLKKEEMKKFNIQIPEPKKEPENGLSN